MGYTKRIIRDCYMPNYGKEKKKKLESINVFLAKLSQDVGNF